MSLCSTLPAVNTRVIPGGFEKKNYTLALLNELGEYIANVVNRPEYFCDLHTLTQPCTFKPNPTGVVSLPDLPLDQVKIGDCVFVFSTTNNIKAQLSVESIDIAKQTCVITGEMAKIFKPGNSNARVIISRGNQLLDLGYVLSIANVKQFKPFPGFEQPNQLRVATYLAKKSIMDDYPFDLPCVKPSKKAASTQRTKESIRREFQDELNKLTATKQFKVICHQISGSSCYTASICYKNGDSKLMIDIAHMSKHSYRCHAFIQALSSIQIKTQEEIRQCEDKKESPDTPSLEKWVDVFNKIIEKIYEDPDKLKSGPWVVRVDNKNVQFQYKKISGRTFYVPNFYYVKK